MVDTTASPEDFDEHHSSVFHQQTDVTNEDTPKVSAAAVNRKRGRPTKKGNDVNKDWKDEKVYILIEIWQQHDNLYNTTNQLYFNREARQKSLENILRKLEENGITSSTKQIGKKIADLKTYYGARKRMSENSKSSGAGTSYVYVSSWKFYDVLHFLNDAFTPRQTANNAGSSYRTTNGSSKKSAKMMKDNKNENPQRIMTTASAALEKFVEPKKDSQDQQKGEDDCFL